MSGIGDRHAAAAEACETFLLAASDDLELLAQLHDREPTKRVLSVLRRHPLEASLGLVLTSRDALAALDAMRAALDALPASIDSATLDDLAAGYADVYLRYAYRAAPTESVWLTEDGLERQGPMFALRDTYRRHGLKVADSERRPDDHLVLQLRFAAHCVKSAKGPEDAAGVAVFLDQHLLRWIRRFASRLAHTGAPDLYVALALVTATYLDEFRDHLTALTGVARTAGAESAPKGPPRVSITVEDRPYVPGVGPSW